MSAVSSQLRKVIKELQKLPGLEKAALGGGTNLALRYNHRISIDIDLFFSGIIGKSGFEQIVSELKEYYKGDIFGLTMLSDVSDQYIFLRFFIKTDEVPVKVDIMQNMLMIADAEIIDGLNLITLTDIGIFKLVTAANRASYKDIYDLDYLTDHISLLELFAALTNKQNLFNKEIHKNIFDLDDPKSPVKFPYLLLRFDESISIKSSRPNHSHNRIEVVEGNKTWMQARSSWRKKVRQLFDALNLEFPAPKTF